MKHTIAINGYGRIGRCIARALYESPEFYKKIRLAAINDIASKDTVAHLTKFDSTHGKFPVKVGMHNGNLLLDQDKIHLFQQESMDNLPWAELGIDVVLDCTGVFGERQTAMEHIKAGAKKVIFSHPGRDEMDATIVYGVNDSCLKKTDQIISNASCTSNCAVPILDVLEKGIGIQSGGITTVHSAMNDQSVIDTHHTDLRKARSAISSIVPVSTNLDKGIAKILPEMTGKLAALSLRVPTANVSLMDICLVMKKETCVEEVHGLLRHAADTRLSGILGVNDDQLVSCDFNHDPRSCIVDLMQTRVTTKRHVKIQAWFDNEWGFANRMLDTTIAALDAQ